MARRAPLREIRISTPFEGLGCNGAFERVVLLVRLGRHGGGDLERLVCRSQDALDERVADLLVGVGQNGLCVHHGRLQFGSALGAGLHGLDDAVGLCGDRLDHGRDGLRGERGPLDRVCDHRHQLRTRARVGLEPLVGGVLDNLGHLGRVVRLHQHPPVEDGGLHGRDGDADQLVDALGESHVERPHHADLRGRRPSNHEPALVLGDLDLHAVGELSQLGLLFATTVAEAGVADLDRVCRLGSQVSDQLHHADGVDQLADLQLVLLVQRVVVGDVPEERELLAAQRRADVVDLRLDGLDVLH